MKRFQIVLGICMTAALIATGGCSKTKSDPEPVVRKPPEIVYRSSASISVDLPHDLIYNIDPGKIADDLDAIKQSHVNLATTPAVLTLAINDDINDMRVRLDRIRKTSYFVGDTARTVKLLKEELSVTPVKDTILIRISLTGPNPAELPDVVNAVADALVHFSLKRAESATSKRMKDLSLQVSEVNDQIALLQIEIDASQDGPNARLMAERMRTLQGRAEKTAAALIELRISRDDAPLEIQARAERPTIPFVRR